jgi:hypothetical protein
MSQSLIPVFLCILAAFKRFFEWAILCWNGSLASPESRAYKAAVCSMVKSVL